MKMDHNYSKWYFSVSALRKPEKGLMECNACLTVLWFCDGPQAQPGCLLIVRIKCVSICGEQI